MQLDPKTSTHILNTIYDGVQQGRKLKPEIYLSLAWSLILPLFALFLIIQGKKTFAYGNASFATAKDILKMEMNFKKGFILAKFQGKNLCYDNGLSCLLVDRKSVV